jgi:tetratricopeptide (TPR) repeat protein
MAEDYAQALQLNPTRQWYWHERGYAYMRLKEHEKAIADHSRTIELGDSDPGERVRRGYSYQALGNLAKAEEDYSRAIELNPSDGEAWQARGRLYLQMGLPDKAKADFADSLSRSNNPDDENALAWALSTNPDPKFCDPKTAVELAEKAVAARPADGEIWNTLGVAQYRVGNWQAAIAALDKSMELRNGGSGEDWFFLAMADYQLGKRDEARKWYDRAVRWNNESTRSEDMHRFQAEAEAMIGPPAASNRASPTTHPESN